MFIKGNHMRGAQRAQERTDTRITTMVLPEQIAHISEALRYSGSRRLHLMTDRQTDSLNQCKKDTPPLRIRSNGTSHCRMWILTHLIFARYSYTHSSQTAKAVSMACLCLCLCLSIIHCAFSPASAGFSSAGDDDG